METWDVPFRKRDRVTIVFLVVYWIGLLSVGGGGQAPAATSDPEQDKHERACQAQPISEARTYSFRTLPPLPPGPVGAYGQKPWYLKFFGWVPGVSKLGEHPTTIAERSMEVSYPSRTKPFYESARSKALRESSEARLKQLETSGEQGWQAWLQANSDASQETRASAESNIRFRGLGLLKAPRFIWDESTGVRFDGPPGNQGLGCNVCWAFATVDAFQAARQIAWSRAGKQGLVAIPGSARQLIGCMLPKETPEFCAENWPSQAFTFMVDKGMPLGGSIFYVPEVTAPACDPEDYVKGLTWDYISAVPGGTATTDEIKRALVTYGPVVSRIEFDACLELYGSGTFNEEAKSGGTHFLLITGWDDSKHAWRVRNSWGQEWGEGGYGWIKYGSNGIGKVAAFVVPDPREDERINAKFGGGAR
ncbi:MAG TPA: C1 family peptidase [Pyrinomonadaceae bacterium]|jgi:hypothetical protein|nr:C1 family peptidase [Pyrinomonadaceae bacterium]